MYFHSTQIFIQLELKLFFFNKKITIQLQLKLFFFNTNIHTQFLQSSISQMSFCWQTICGIVKCLLFFQANIHLPCGG